VVIGAIIYVTALFFVDIDLAHPGAMVALLVLTSVTFCLFGFIIGIWADGFEQLSFVPILVVTPLTFLGGAFYTIDMLPPVWQTVSLFNPVVYLISAFRWSFFGQGDVAIEVSLGLTFAFLVVCLMVVTWMFRSGYRLKA
jgi:ABC-2 type transport system permease protein